MIYTEKTNKALKLCFRAHKDQVDKSGVPYVFHPFHLADQMQTEKTVIVALLHDVMEDTKISYEELAKEGFGEDVMEALLLLYHKKGVDYMDYVRPIRENPIARAVKIADLKHNSDLSRLLVVDKKALDRVEKYAEALAYLEENH
jgi:(p)ppGpp synthase/HD superfamily hydrolase